MTGALVLAAAGTGFALTSLPAQATPTTRYVAVSSASTDTDNDCTDPATPCATVGHAVARADAGDTVNIGPGTYHESIRIRKPLTLIGAGATGGSATIIDGDHDGDASVFIDGNDVGQTVAVTIKNIAVDNNVDSDGIDISGDATLDLLDSTASNNQESGLVVQVNRATATVENSSLDGNGADGVLGTQPLEQTAAANKPALVVASDITISNSDLSNNLEFGLGLDFGASGAVDHSSLNRNGRGGAVAGIGSSLNLNTSTVDGNGENGVAIGSGSTATVTASTISNTVPASGDTDFGGAGLSNISSTLDVEQSTIVGNTGQGVHNIGGVTTVANSTINGTKASVDESPSGGLVNTTPEIPTVTARTERAAKADIAVDTPASLTVTGSIVAEQAGTTPDCNGDVVDGGFNLSSDAANSCKFSSANSDLVSTNPLLGALADNGGPTQTELLLKGSPAIDAITAGNANCVSGATDQRGVARPQPVGGACDTGAVELAADPLVVHPDSLPNGTVGQPYDATVTATGGAYPTYVFSLVAGDSLPPGLGMDSNGHITGTPTTAGSFTFTVSVNDPVLKQYTIVIAPVASSSTPTPTPTPTTSAPSSRPPGSSSPGGSSSGGSPSTPAPSSSSSSSPVLAITGVHTASLLSVAAAALLAGLALLFGTGRLGRRPRRSRSH